MKGWPIDSNVSKGTAKECSMISQSCIKYVRKPTSFVILDNGHRGATS